MGEPEFMSREEREQFMLQRQQEEKMRMKEVMIRICTYLEDRYLKEVTAVCDETDDSLHYDIQLEYSAFNNALLAS